MKTVLVCPLDWGLGHATRCIPIIRILIERGNKVIIASDNLPMEILRQEFPNTQTIKLEGYNIRYPKKISMTWKMLISSPKILYSIITEHKKLKRIIKEYKIDIVISDNRYGLWNKNIQSIFITHQLRILSPIRNKIIENFLQKINFFFINKYDECWIPDFEGEENLSGELSHNIKLKQKKNIFYVGPLSRFFEKPNNDTKAIYNFTAIFSGPEPQRTIFQDLVINEMKGTSLKGNIIEGMPGKDISIKKFENLNIYSHLNSSDLEKMISNSEVIICRSGYSSIMDLCVLNKKAILVPTPGQTEQEYLADYFKEKKYFYSVPQKTFSLKNSLNQFYNYTGIQISSNAILITERLKYLEKN
ncbi:MAG: glycosyltransferase [Bacteroidetes bacterium]|nr:glycosyltransferase [Bacteroidota bacterium]